MMERCTKATLVPQLALVIGNILYSNGVDDRNNPSDVEGTVLADTEKQGLLLRQRFKTIGKGMERSISSDFLASVTYYFEVNGPLRLATVNLQAVA
jgi:hypothetical protein